DPQEHHPPGSVTVVWGAFVRVFATRTRAASAASSARPGVGRFRQNRATSIGLSTRDRESPQENNCLLIRGSWVRFPPRSPSKCKRNQQSTGDEYLVVVGRCAVCGHFFGHFSAFLDWFRSKSRWYCVVSADARALRLSN